MSSMVQQIVAATQLPQAGVAAAVGLFDEGATLPFVARYRKERTGGLDEVQLRQIVELQRQIAEVDQRRGAILDALTKLGKLTPALERALADARRKQELEDLYAPFKQSRVSKGDVAREAGLQPLAELILKQPRAGDVAGEARRFVRGAVASVEDALQGARDIVAEELAADPERRAAVRRAVGDRGVFSSTLKKGQDGTQYKDYLDFEERAARIPSHRYLALCRGEEAGILAVKLQVDRDALLRDVLRGCGLVKGSPYAAELEAAAEDALKRLLLPAAERAIRKALKAWADDDAIDVFQKNLEALLLSAPLGPQKVLGLDPGIRTGCKAAVVSETGDLLAHDVFHLVGRSNPQRGELLACLQRHRPHAVAVGNGTGGREAEALVRDLVRDHALPIVVVSVSEAGASVYSASELAGAELPDVDLTVRGAVSIARRLQDPLAELVKVEPKALGVGQYQHDVDAAKLERRLDEVVESCVNRVGVHLNTASPALLAHVAGLGAKRASAVVSHRQQHGKFRRRKDLLAVPGLGQKTFEQCAGFLRIADGDDPLDNSAVHPERYALVQRMARDLGLPVGQVVGSSKLSELKLAGYQDEHTGLATLQDIVTELQKPGRDPREPFEAPAFRDDVREVADLVAGMELDGIVTNVTNFGAFVDVGVHQDGLVHISALSDHFVRDPHEVVQPGSRVKVRVLEVDVARKRIALTMKKEG